MTNVLTDFFTDDIFESVKKDKNDMKKNYPISQVAETEWKKFALYTLENRAIPNLCDGLKPVQRFYLYSSIKNTKTHFKKVDSVAGVITDYGYNHGTSSAAGAGQLMAAEWNNNVCLVEGEGSFGTRLVQQAASSRYTKTKLHDNFFKYIKDIDLSPVHVDPEHEPPAYYLPVIPLVLVNGIKGIATGFATNVLPRDPDDLLLACKEYLSTGKIKEKVKLKFPQFTGTVTYNSIENRYYCIGTFERKGKTGLTITEVPYGYDREEYIKILDKLEETDDIVGYDDLCGKTGFKFEVKLKQNSSALWTEDEIIKNFKLSKPFTENLTVIDQNGKLKEYTDERDLIADFCDFRNIILQKRIELRKQEYTEEGRWLKVKMQFIQSILDNKIEFKNRKKDMISKQILELTSALTTDLDKLLRINMLSLTDEMVRELEKEIKETNKNWALWNKTTVKLQFLEDLTSI